MLSEVNEQSNWLNGKVLLKKKLQNRLTDPRMLSFVVTEEQTVTLRIFRLKLNYTLVYYPLKVGPFSFQASAGAGQKV